jgi:hypothetical protein
MGAYLNGVMICGVNEKLYLFGNNTDEIAIYNEVDGKIKGVVHTGNDTNWIPITGILEKKYIICGRSNETLYNRLLIIDLGKNGNFASASTYTAPEYQYWRQNNAIFPNGVCKRFLNSDGSWTAGFTPPNDFSAMFCLYRPTSTYPASRFFLSFKSGKFTVWDLGTTTYAYAFAEVSRMPWKFNGASAHLKNPNNVCYLMNTSLTSYYDNIRLFWIDEAKTLHQDLIPYPSMITEDTSNSFWQYVSSQMSDVAGYNSYGYTPPPGTTAPYPRHPLLIKQRVFEAKWRSSKYVSYFVYDIIDDTFWAIDAQNTRIN